MALKELNLDVMGETLLNISEPIPMSIVAILKFSVSKLGKINSQSKKIIVAIKQEKRNNNNIISLHKFPQNSLEYIFFKVVP